MEDKRSDSEKLGQCLQKLGDEMECNGRYNGFALGGTESKLRKNISAISAILEEMIQSRVMDSLSSTVNNMKSETAALYVCGVPGTGKSSGIQFCCNRILDRAKNNPTFMQGVEPIVVEINAAHLAACKTGDSLKSKVVNDIWEKCDSSMSKRTENALFKRLSSTRAGKKPGFVILVLDEVDQLMKENETKATNAAEKLLEQLNKWASDPTCRFALICIGNSMNNSKQRRLEEFVKVWNSSRFFCLLQSTINVTNSCLLQFYRTFIFSAYSKEDIIEILQARIGEEIIEPNALTFIAGKIANTSGDVRDAIGLAKKAIQAAQQKVSDDKEGKCVETNSSGKKDFLVKMRDVVRLNAEVQKCSQLLAGLPTNAKFVATVFVDLIRKYAGSADAMTRRDFEQACIDTSHRNNPDTYVDRATITSGIGLLEDNGIFRVSRRSEIDPGFDEIACEFHAQEVEMAVKEALGADYELLSGFLV